MFHVSFSLPIETIIGDYIDMQAAPHPENGEHAQPLLQLLCDSLWATTPIVGFTFKLLGQAEEFIWLFDLA